MATALETNVLEAQPRKAGTKNEARRVLRDGGAVVLSGVRDTAEARDIVIRDPRAPQGFQLWDAEKARAEWDGLASSAQAPWSRQARSFRKTR